jgi:hypothetical protein
MYTNHILMQILEINIFMEQILSLFQNLFKALFGAAICGRGMRFTTHLRPVLKLRMNGVIIPLPPTLSWYG